MAFCALITMSVAIAISGANQLILKSFEASTSNTVTILCNLQNNLEEHHNDLWLLINARLLFKSTLHQQILIENVPLSENRYSIAIYLDNDHDHKNKNKPLQLAGVNEIDISLNSIVQQQYDIHNMDSKNMVKIDYSQPYQQLLVPVLSTYYATINVLTAQTWQNITYNMKQLNMNGDAPTIETVVRSNDDISISDLIGKWNWTLHTNNTSIKPVQQSTKYYHEKPSKFGYYCIYTNPDKNTNIIPDCPNTTEIITEHAKMLYSSGIDFMMPDDTNLVNGPDNIASYTLQIKPNENIFSVFSNLKHNGTNVPLLAFWNRATGDQWMTNLQLMNNYSDLIYSTHARNEPNKPIKKVYFINTNKGIVNQTVINAIKSNGGNNDVQVIFMWCNYNKTMLNSGYWVFMQPCTTINKTSNDEQIVKTTSIQTANECNYWMTKNSNLGSQIAATMAWNHGSFGSLNFGSPTKLNGRTFQLIIKDCLSLQPDNIHFPSFNEHTHSSGNLGNNNTWSNGLYKDKNRCITFGDTYGSEVNRAFEPTKESGDYYYLLFQSCVRVVRLQYYFGELLNKADNASVCNVEHEICCNNMTQYENIWSLKGKNDSDYILSNNESEVNELKGNGYLEICAVLPYANTTVFCQSRDNLYRYAAHQGPFILYKNEKELYGMIGSLAVVNITRVPIYRCIANENGSHFIANTKDCDGITNSTLEYVLGYAASQPSTAMGRRVVRCENATNGIYYTAVGDDCVNKNKQNSVLGYAL